MQESPAQRELAKCPTGIQGFELTLGGLPRGQTALVCGGPGCGKTLFGIEFLVLGATEFGEPEVSVAFDLSKMEAGKFDFVDEPFDLHDLTEKVSRPLGVRAHQKGLELLQAANGAKRPYELLVVDCQMPGMDGFQLIERAKRGKFAQPVILMLTSDDLPACSAREVGAAACLVKPVSCAELVATVQTVLGNEPPRAPGCGEADSVPAEPTGAPGGESLRVLLAEDNAVNQVRVRTLIERKGWSIRVVENGRAALEALSREPFDVVLMDVQMPVLDGYEATRALRSLERKASGVPRRTPVIGLTAHALREDRLRCLAAGMDDYLPKPTEPQDLYDAIMRQVRRTPWGAERRGPPAEVGPTLRDNTDLLRGVTEIFLKDYPKKLAALREAVEKRSAEDIESAAHGLLGSLLIFGARRAAEGTRLLQACAREGRLEETPALLESLEQELQRLAGFLAKLS